MEILTHWLMSLPELGPQDPSIPDETEPPFLSKEALAGHRSQALLLQLPPLCPGTKNLPSG
jgi:hypothetical protein